MEDIVLSYKCSEDPNEYYVAPNQYPNGGGGGFPAVAVAASITSPRSPSQGDFRQYDTDGSASTSYGYQQFCYGYRPGSLVSCGKSCDCNDYPYCNQYPQTCCDRGICICRPGKSFCRISQCWKVFLWTFASFRLLATQLSVRLWISVS